MKSQIQSLSTKIQDSKQNSPEYKTEELKKEIKEYIKNYGGESIEISNSQIETRESIKNIFEEFILEESLETKEIEEKIFSLHQEIFNPQQEISQKLKNTIGETIKEYTEQKEILEDLNNLTIGEKFDLLKQINGENFKYKISQTEQNQNQENPYTYKTISELTKQEKKDLIKKEFSKLNPKLELKKLKQKRLSHQEGEKNSYLHLNQENGVVRNYYQVLSNLKYFERKLSNNEYINFPSLNSVYNKLETNYKTKKPVYLVGETGGGKTELAKKFLQDKIDELHPENKNKSPKEKISPIIINSNQDTSSSELESTRELVTEQFIDSNGETKHLTLTKEIFQGLKKGASEGIPVILDEVNKMPQGTLGILNEYLSQVADSGIYNGHSKVKKGFFVIMTGNEGENYLARNELDPSIKRRVDTIQYPYLDKKDLAYLVTSQLNNFNKYQYKEIISQKNQNSQEITAEPNFDKSIQGLINGFNQIQKDFEENRYREDGEEKDFIYKIPSPDIGTIKNIIKKYDVINNQNIQKTQNTIINTTLEIQILEDYITKDIYNLDSQIYLFNIFKNNGLYKNFNEIIPQELENLLNKSSEEKKQLVDKIKEYIKQEKENLRNQNQQNKNTKTFTKLELILPFHEELNNEENDDLFNEIEQQNQSNQEEDQNQEKQNQPKIDLSQIDDIQEQVEKQRFANATEKEKEILNNWETKYPDWSSENLNKIFFHKEGIELKIEGLEGKKIQRENLKATPNGTTIFEIPEKELKNLSPEKQEKLKDEQLFTWKAGMKESKKQGLKIPSDNQWQAIIDLMPGEDEDEKYFNCREFLDLQLSGNRTTYGAFVNQGSYGYYWSSTENSSTNARHQRFNTTGGTRSSYDKDIGFSVRCFKD